MATIIFVLACLGGVFSADFITAPNHFAQLYGTPDSPRGMFVDEAGDLLYVSERARSIFVQTEIINENGTIDIRETQLVNGRTLGIKLNHAVLHHQGYLYASSDIAVYRWPYVAGSHDLGPNVPTETVIDNIPGGGTHFTRCLAFDGQTSVLYVHLGSLGNVDENSIRARINRFDLSDSAVFPIDFYSGVLFADGLRNEVGIVVDKSGILWGVENSADNLDRPDLGFDIRNGNPAEELHRFDAPVGTHYGYPYCFSTDVLEGYAPLTQFAWPDTMNDGIHTDEWCQNITNNHPPLMALPAHAAPLGIVFYDGIGCDNGIGGFPCDMTGDAFVALHGSWNSDFKVGYRVIRIPFTKTQPYLPTGEILDVIYEPDLINCESNCFRPVNAVFNKNGHLFVSVDSTDELFKVTYGVLPPPPPHDPQSSNTNKRLITN